MSCRGKKAFDAVKKRIFLLENGIKLYESIIEKEGIECEWKKSGMLTLFLSSEELEKHNFFRKLEMKFGVKSSITDHKQLKNFLSGMDENIKGGCFYEKNALIRPDYFMKEMKRILIKKGVEIIEQTAAVSFRMEKGKAVAVLTDRGDFGADEFLLATGAWTPFFNKAIGAKIPIQPGKGYSVTIKRPDSSPTVPCLFKEKKVVASPWGSGYRIGGTMEFSGYDTNINKKRINFVIKGHKEYFPGIDFERDREDWYGWRPMTYDGLPIIDSSPALKNVVIAAGHNMIGMSAGPATGKLITAILCNEISGVEIEAFGCRRF